MIRQKCEEVWETKNLGTYSHNFRKTRKIGFTGFNQVSRITNGCQLLNSPDWSSSGLYCGRLLMTNERQRQTKPRSTCTDIQDKCVITEFECTLLPTPHNKNYFCFVPMNSDRCSDENGDKFISFIIIFKNS